jgi:hypothetical protein
MHCLFRRTSAVSARLAAVLIALLAVSGCVATTGRDAPREKVPGLIVALAEPAAEPGGRAIAHIKARPGFLSRHPAAIARIRTQLQPLDIVTVSSKHRLSARFIQGYFTHVAVYLGKAGDLRAEGIAVPATSKNGIVGPDDPVFIESEHDGVRLADLPTVLDTDAVAVLRARMSADQRKTARAALFAHLGSKFDFHMNADDDERLFCAELVDHAMPWLKLPRSEFYGRSVIFPARVAEMALVGDRLSVVTYVRAVETRWESPGTKALAEAIAKGW